MSNSEIPKPPAKLQKAGRAMWRRLAEAFEFNEPHELHTLQHACELEDDIARLREALTDAPLVVPGSYKQPVEQPMLNSIRQAVALQHKLLLTMGVEDVYGKSFADRSRAGTQAAMKRWGGRA